MANMNVNTTSTASLSAENKTFYQKLLIQTAEAELIHEQFGQVRPIPPRSGKTCEFRKFDPLPEVTTPLTEGVTPDGQTPSVKTVTATVDWYGAYIAESTELNLTAIDNMVVEDTKLASSQGGRSMDTVVANIMNGGTNVMYGGGVASRAAIQYTGEDNNCNMTVDLVRKAVRTLEEQSAPRIDGYYVAIVHPRVKYDLMKDKDWKDPNTYKDRVDHIFKGELGELYGVRFVESPRAKVFSKAGAAPTGKTEGIDVYSTLFLGENAYGVIPVEGSGMEIIIKQKGSGGTSDPLDQRSTVGWKCGKTAAILVQTYMLRVETSATP